MESAGKRESRPPIRLIDQLLSSDKNMGPTTTTTTTTSTTSISTPSTSNPTASRADPTIHQMFAQLIASNEKHRAQTEIFQQQTTQKLSESLERWRSTDARVANLEYDTIRNTTNNLKQEETNVELSRRLECVEKDVFNFRNELNLVSKQSCVSPNVQPQTTATINAPTSSHDPARFSFVNVPERLQDAVSEFSGHIPTLHPEKFLEQLRIYFDSVPLSPVQQLMSAQRRLIDDARLWYEALIPTPRDYAEFLDLFRKRYWSTATQRKLRNDVFRPYQYTRQDGLATHAMQWIASAKYLTPPIDKDDLVSTIIRHYPTALGMALRGRGPRDTNELLCFLTEFEESASFCESQRDNNRPRPQAPPQNGGGRGNHQGPHRPYQGNNRYQRPPYVPPQEQYQPEQQQNNNQPISQLDISGNARASHS